MAAPKGNKFWEARATSGRKPIFESPEHLWDSAVEYFEWVESNPIWANKVTQYQGVPVDMPVAKMRAMTVGAMCIFLDITHQAWLNYCEREDFIEVTSKIKQIIYSQKLEGAAADELNANIIARELGLKDASTQEFSGPNGGPIGVRDMSSLSDDELQAIIDAES